MVVTVVSLRTLDDHNRVPGLDLLDDGTRAPFAGLLPPPGFDQIAIPVPRREQSLHLSSTETTQRNEAELARSRGGSLKVGSGEEGLRRGGEGNGAFTLLIVEDNAVNRRIKTSVCDRWGQPYELAENGQVAVDMYKRNPERFRCIWMDTLMPVLDGYSATRQIRAFEQERWQAYTEVTSSSSNNQHRDVPKPVRRAVILMQSWHGQRGEAQRCTDAGADVVLTGLLYVRQIADLLFSGPETNAVSVYGAVDDEDLRRAGYPLRVRPLKSRRTAEVLERAAFG